MRLAARKWYDRTRRIRSHTYVCQRRGQSRHCRGLSKKIERRRRRRLLHVPQLFSQHTNSILSPYFVFGASSPTMASAAPQQAHHHHHAPEPSLAPTIGSHIDAFIEQLDSLSSTQLYALIVGLTVIICFVLLGNAPDTTTTASSSALSLTDKSSSKKATVRNTGPEPRWQYFRYLNYFIVAAFVYSVMDFIWKAQHDGVLLFQPEHHHHHHSSHGLSHGTLLKFLVAWSFFLWYFFAFFGVSFVHADLSTAAADDAVVDSSRRNHHHHPPVVKSASSNG